MPTLKHDTQIYSHSDPKLLFPILLFPHSTLVKPYSVLCTLLTAHPISAHWKIPTCSPNGNSEIASVELFLMTSKAAPSLPPLCSHDTLGRSPLYHSPYFIIVNCVHICLPHCMICLPFKGKDNVLPIPHPSSTQQSVCHRISN